MSSLLDLTTKGGLSQKELSSLVDRHTLAVQSWLASRSPDAAVYHGQGVTAASTGLGVRLLNLALGGHFLVDATDEDIEGEIKVVIDFFFQRGVPWYWWLGPTARPEDLRQRLLRAGLTQHSALPAMAAVLKNKLEGLQSAKRLAPDQNLENIHVWQARDQNDLRAASAIRRTAFGFPQGQALNYFEDMAEDWLRGDPARLYLARLEDGPPLAIGALILGDGAPGVYIMATLPQWGRRGLGSAILGHILSQAAAEGYPWIGLTAGTQGYPLYQKFGFERVFDYSLIYA